MSGLHTVHVRVNDAATGQPTPVRIRFLGPNHEYYAPLGRLTAIPTRPNEDLGGNLHLGKDLLASDWAYIDGACEILLPSEPITVEVHKGPEYKPIRQTEALGPGKMSLRLQIERWIDLRQQRWHSGDVQAHFLSPHAALLEAAAEDLAIVNLLALEWLHTESKPVRTSIPNILAFSGQQPLLERGGHLVAVNTLNQGGILGTLALLNCHRIVFPLSIGLGAEPAIDWTLADWCDQCHRKGGLVVWAGFGRSWTGDHEEGYSGECLADLALGKIDAVAVAALDGPRNRLLDEWYRFLGCGFRIPLVGGSAKVSNAQALGHVRTYARLAEGEEFSYRNWIEAVRAGRTFVTNGPLLTLTVNGLDPGAVIELPPKQAKVAVCAECQSGAPFDRLELVHNGVVIAGTEVAGTGNGQGGSWTARLEGNLEVPASGWLAGRCWSERAQVYGAGRPYRVAAHTSPAWVQLQGQPMPVDAISLALLLERIDKILLWVEHGPRFKSDKVKADLLAVITAARNVLVGKGVPGAQ